MDHHTASSNQNHMLPQQFYIKCWPLPFLGFTLFVSVHPTTSTRRLIWTYFIARFFVPHLQISKWNMRPFTHSMFFGSFYLLSRVHTDPTHPLRSECKLIGHEYAWHLEWNMLHDSTPRIHVNMWPPTHNWSWLCHWLHQFRCVLWFSCHIFCSIFRLFIMA